MVYIIILLTINTLILLWINWREKRIEEILDHECIDTTVKFINSRRREVETLKNSRRLIKRVDRVLKKI